MLTWIASAALRVAAGQVRDAVRRQVELRCFQQAFSKGRHDDEERVAQLERQLSLQLQGRQVNAPWAGPRLGGNWLPLVVVFASVLTALELLRPPCQ